MNGLIASFSTGLFRRQNKADMVNADNNPTTGAEVTSAELGQGAFPDTTSLLTEEPYSVPPVDTDPPWVALYLARERAEDQLWEEKLKRSAWGALRGVVGFGAAGGDRGMTKQSGDGVLENGTDDVRNLFSTS